MTLLEMLVVLVVMAILWGVVAISSPRPEVPAALGTFETVADARAASVRTGRPVAFRLPADTTVLLGTAFPDGTVVVDSDLGVDRLTGRIQEYKQ